MRYWIVTERGGGPMVSHVVSACDAEEAMMEYRLDYQPLDHATLEVSEIGRAAHDKRASFDEQGVGVWLR